MLRSTATGGLVELEVEPTHEFAMARVADQLFLIRSPGTETWTPVTFYQLPTGERYLHNHGRATPLKPATGS